MEIQSIITGVNGITNIPVSSGTNGNSRIVLAFSGALTGTVKVEARLATTGAYRAVPGLDAVAFAAGEVKSVVIAGVITDFRVTLSNIANAGNLLFSASDLVSQSMPTGLFEGLRAITTQNYTEANVKNGLQFEASNITASLAAAASLNFLFITGSKRVIIKDSLINTTATLAEYHVYRSPTATQGAAVTIYNLNDEPAWAQAPTVTMFAATSVTNTGTEIGSPIYIVGSTGQGQTVFGTYNSRGSERILRANSTYLTRFTNTGATACAVSTYITWYEGDPDLPLLK